MALQQQVRAIGLAWPASGWHKGNRIPESLCSLLQAAGCMHRRSICKAHLGECFLQTACCPYGSSWPHCIPSLAGGRLPTCLPQLSRPVSLDCLCCAGANCPVPSALPLTPRHLAQATLRHQGLQRQQLTARHIAHAALSMPQTTDIQKLSDEDRTELAHRLGYRQIGRELPDDVTLGQIIKSMPQEVRPLFMRAAKHPERAQSCTEPQAPMLTGPLLSISCLLPAHIAAESQAFHRSLGPSCKVPNKRSAARLAVQQSSHSCQDLQPRHLSMAQCCPHLTPSSQGLMPCRPCPAGI